MPQMMPMSWLTMYLVVNMLFIMMNVMLFYMYMPSNYSPNVYSTSFKSDMIMYMN
uniref:ATP synthase F0 subunit 8 n=1 Tax=Docophoroides brevis TaxID=160119 RepID=UPI00211DFE96|nr:ATP synthase F0 subunit 8 [Docophoroides brevis]UTT72585.1 ATP synthase F0 subunit 8 [Docophoroides brevis]